MGARKGRDRGEEEEEKRPATPAFFSRLLSFSSLLKRKKTPFPPLVLRVDDPLGSDRERGVPLGEGRARHDLGHALLAAALLQPQPGRRGVRLSEERVFRFFSFFF